MYTMASKYISSLAFIMTKRTLEAWFNSAFIFNMPVQILLCIVYFATRTTIIEVGNAAVV